MNDIQSLYLLVKRMLEDVASRMWRAASLQNMCDALKDGQGLPALLKSYFGSTREMLTNSSNARSSSKHHLWYFTGDFTYRRRERLLSGVRTAICKMCEKTIECMRTCKDKSLSRRSTYSPHWAMNCRRIHE